MTLKKRVHPLEVQIREVFTKFLDSFDGKDGASFFEVRFICSGFDT